VVGKSSLIILLLHSTVQSFLLQALERLSVLNMLTALGVTVLVAIALTGLSERIINRHQVLSRLFYAR
jgi:fucose 4-O-acetylase-like acetyltransferase